VKEYDVRRILIGAAVLGTAIFGLLWLLATIAGL